VMLSTTGVADGAHPQPESTSVLASINPPAATSFIFCFKFFIFVYWTMAYKFIYKTD